MVKTRLSPFSEITTVRLAITQSSAVAAVIGGT